jgi:hypothetical protein
MLSALRIDGYIRQALNTIRIHLPGASTTSILVHSRPKAP